MKVIEEANRKHEESKTCAVASRGEDLWINYVPPRPQVSFVHCLTSCSAILTWHRSSAAFVRTPSYRTGSPCNSRAFSSKPIHFLRTRASSCSKLYPPISSPAMGPVSGFFIRQFALYCIQSFTKSTKSIAGLGCANLYITRRL